MQISSKDRPPNDTVSLVKEFNDDCVLKFTQHDSCSRLEFVFAIEGFFNPFCISFYKISNDESCGEKNGLSFTFQKSLVIRSLFTFLSLDQ